LHFTASLRLQQSASTSGISSYLLRIGASFAWLLDPGGVFGLSTANHGFAQGGIVCIYCTRRNGYAVGW
jgi:hypothetical protein